MIKIERLSYWDNEEMQEKLNKIDGRIVSIQIISRPWTVAPSLATAGRIEIIYETSKAEND